MDATGADDRDLAESIHAFEAAVSVQPTPLIAPRVRRILCVLDGSNQDDTTSVLAMAMARRFETVLTFFDSTRGEGIRHRLQVLEELGLEGDVITAEVDRPDFEQVLEARHRRGCDLIVVDVPHGEGFAELGDASVGTNLDMLMTRSPAPLLVVREPKSDPAVCLGSVLLPLTLHEPTVSEAASWALRVIGSDGAVRLLAVVDREHVESSAAAVETDLDLMEMDESALAGLRRPDMAGLISVVQRRSSELGLGCRVSVRVGETVAVVVELGNEREGLVVTGFPRRPVAPGFQRAQALVRASRNPVLLV